jgi:hypothetical protein
MFLGKKIDWDLFQIVLLVATLPLMIIAGALLPHFFTPTYLP